jgi:hypothetical protein
LVGFIVQTIEGSGPVIPSASLAAEAETVEQLSHRCIEGRIKDQLGMFTFEVMIGVASGLKGVA